MKEEILHLAGGPGSIKRRELDFYPTPDEVTIALMDFLKLDPSQTIWECAAGNGQMARVIKTYGHKVIETDIITGDDYLTTKINADAIITNPPFSLSHLFIEKAIHESKTVAMLLKSQYWHAKKRLPLFERHPPRYVLPLTWRPNFYETKGSSTMEVGWSVWTNSDSKEWTKI